MDLVGPIVNIVDGLVNRDLRMQQAEAAEAQARLQQEQLKQQAELARLEAQKMQTILLYGVAGLGILTAGYVAFKYLGK